MQIIWVSRDNKKKKEEAEEKEKDKEFAQWFFLLFYLFWGVCVQFNQGSKDQEQNKSTMNKFISNIIRFALKIYSVHDDKITIQTNELK